MRDDEECRLPIDECRIAIEITQLSGAGYVSYRPCTNRAFWLSHEIIIQHSSFGIHSSSPSPEVTYG